MKNQQITVSKLLHMLSRLIKREENQCGRITLAGEWNVSEGFGACKERKQLIDYRI